MSVLETPVSHLVVQKLKYLSQRQEVLASNVANADTPGYKAQELQQPDFAKLVAGSNGTFAAVRTHPSHLAANPLVPGLFTQVPRATTDEVNPNGNNVSIEEEMQMVAVNSADYQLALGIEQGLDKLYNIALGQQSGTK